MKKISFCAVIGLFFVLLFISGWIVSFIFTPDFVEKYIDDDGRIGDAVKLRVEIFQKQMLYTSVVAGIIGILILIFSKKLSNFIKEKRTIFLNIALMLFVLLILILAGEIILRVFFSDQIFAEQGYGPGWIKFEKKASYNSFGYRDVEHTIEKKAKRIIVIGDSFTLGLGIENSEDVFTRILQKKLDIKYGPNKFEVINLGKGGYSTVEELDVLKNLGLKLKPDLVVLAYNVNDVEGVKSRIGFEKLFFHHYLIPWEVGSWFYSHSATYYFFESRTKNILRSFTKSESYNNYISHLYSDSNPALQENIESLKTFFDVCRSEGIPVIILSIPVITDFNNYPFEYVNEYVRNITFSKNSTYVDLIPYFSKYKPEELTISFIDGHMNELGNRLTADALFKAVTPFIEKTYS